LGDIAAISLVRSDYIPELGFTLASATESGQLIINLRAEADPSHLRAAVESALAALQHRQPGLGVRLDHAEQFRPGRPTPTHRTTSTEVIAS
jgi:hypothetical protein